MGASVLCQSYTVTEATVSRTAAMLALVSGESSNLGGLARPACRLSRVCLVWVPMPWIFSPAVLTLLSCRWNSGESVMEPAAAIAVLVPSMICWVRALTSATTFSALPIASIMSFFC